MTEPASDIIIQSRNGDWTAFQKLVQTTQFYAYSLALRLLCNNDDARDVVQESFIRVWKNKRKLDPDKRFTTWLFKIVTNLCLDHLKSRKRKNKTILPVNEFHQQAPANENLEQEYQNQDLILHISRLAKNLTPKQQIVFVLRDLQDMDLQQVCKITGFSKGAVKSNLYYARLNIREQLQKLENQ